MSGTDVPYNIRPNKFVERHYFVELLGKVIRNNSPNDYVYVSLGGPQLEDLKLVHYQLALKNLISLEENDIVYQRQLFNLRPFADCKKQNTEEFMSNLEDLRNDKKFIIWLDFADADQRYKYLTQFEAYLSKLQKGDVLKITLNANVNTLGTPAKGETAEDLQTRRFDKLRNKLGDYVVEPLPEQLFQPTFPIVLSNAVRKASLRATESNLELEPVPLSIFVYQDSDNQMLTVTVALVDSSKVSAFQDDLVLSGWEFLPNDWEDITRIKIPNLTIKERLYIESFLGSKPLEEIHRELPFRLHTKDAESLEIFADYVKFYRKYPSFLEVVV